MGEGTLEVGKRAGWMGQTGGALVPVRLGGGAGKKVWRERVPREAADVGRTTWAGPPGLVVHGGEQARGRVGPVGTRGPVRPPQPRLPAPQGRQLESVKAEAAEKGDVGLVAENSRSTQRLMLPPPALTAAGVFAKFRDIAGLAGSAVSGQGGHPGPQTLGPSPGDPETRRAGGDRGASGGRVASVLLVGRGRGVSPCPSTPALFLPRDGTVDTGRIKVGPEGSRTRPSSLCQSATGLWEWGEVGRGGGGSRARRRRGPHPAPQTPTGLPRLSPQPRRWTSSKASLSPAVTQKPDSSPGGHGPPRLGEVAGARDWPRASPLGSSPCVVLGLVGKRCGD